MDFPREFQSETLWRRCSLGSQTTSRGGFDERTDERWSSLRISRPRVCRSISSPLQEHADTEMPTIVCFSSIWGTRRRPLATSRTVGCISPSTHLDSHRKRYDNSIDWTRGTGGHACLVSRHVAQSPHTTPDPHYRNLVVVVLCLGAASSIRLRMLQVRLTPYTERTPGYARSAYTHTSGALAETNPWDHRPTHQILVEELRQLHHLIASHRLILSFHEIIGRVE